MADIAIGDGISLVPAQPPATAAAKPVAVPSGPEATAAAVFTAAPPPVKTEKPEAKPEAKAHSVLTGFNPSAKIDPDTHIVVLTVKGDNGETLRQMPSEQQLAAYKAEKTAARKV